MTMPGSILLVRIHETSQVIFKLLSTNVLVHKIIFQIISVRKIKNKQDMLLFLILLSTQERCAENEVQLDMLVG